MNTFLTIYSIFVTIWLIALSVYVSRLEYQRKKILNLLEGVVNGMDLIAAFSYVSNPERFKEANISLLGGAVEWAETLEDNITAYRELEREK